MYIALNLKRTSSTEAYTIVNPQNNESVSPLTGKVLNSGKNNHLPVRVTYSPNNTQEFLSGINNADLIFEYLTEDGSLAYNAIFYDNVPSKPKPITNISNVSLSSLPKFTFSQSINKLYSTKKQATYIFITMSYNIYSNFIYEDGYYVHYKDCETDIDSADEQPVSVSNIIIQYTNSSNGIKNFNSCGNGKGLLFCGGRVVDIEWENDGTHPIRVEDEDGNPVTLLEGKTWWIIINDKCPVAFN